MDFSEHTLLNRPSLMLTVLKTASRGEVTLDDCLRHLRQHLARANEPAPVEAQELLAHMEGIKRCLIGAALLMPTTGDGFTATKRGREVLAEHPMGVDETVLMRFPEFREFLRRSAQHPPPEDPRTHQYDTGYAAYQTGSSLVDNPYPPDTIDHLAWENGWFEARDEEFEHKRPLPLAFP